MHRIIRNGFSLNLLLTFFYNKKLEKTLRNVENVTTIQT